MSRNETRVSHHAEGFPRVSGDEPYVYSGMGMGMMFSPRERG